MFRHVSTGEKRKKAKIRMAKSTLKEVGGIKGAVQRSGTWLLDTAAQAKVIGFEYLKWGVKVGGSVSFALATTSMIVLMPLLFEISREGQVRTNFEFRFCCVCSFWCPQAAPKSVHATTTRLLCLSLCVEPLPYTAHCILCYHRDDTRRSLRSWKQNEPKSRT